MKTLISYLRKDVTREPVAGVRLKYGYANPTDRRRFWQYLWVLINNKWKYPSHDGNESPYRVLCDVWRSV